MNYKNLLEKLTNSYCIGHHNEAYSIVKEFLKDFATITESEHFLKAEIDKGAKKTLLLDAHIDEVGMIVTSVSEKGFLTAAPVGSLDQRILPCTRLKVLSGAEEITGLVTSVPPHINKEDTVPSLDNCFIDVGTENIKKISVGDLIVYNNDSLWLSNERFASKSLDNRSGVLTLLAAAEKIRNLNSEYNITLLFSKGEELGLRGAKAASDAILADLCIVVDVSFGDAPDIPTSKTKNLGDGAMIGISPILSKNIYRRLEDIATKNSLPFSLEVMGGNTSTNADVLSLAGSGVPTGLISIPLRNMHTPYEIVDMKDIENAAELIALFAKEGM